MYPVALAVLSRSVAALLAIVLATGLPRCQEVAWAWVSPTGSTSTFTPSASYQHNTAGGAITVTPDQQQQNRFLVRVPNMPGRGVVHVSAYGGNHTAVVEDWFPSNGDLIAIVQTFSATGNPAANAPFAFRYRVLGDLVRREAYLWADQPQASSYNPPVSTRFSSNGATPTITRLGIGLYEVHLPSYSPTGWSNKGGNVQVTPYASHLVRAKALQWVSLLDEMVITVQCTNQTGVPTDSRFFLSYMERADGIDPADGTSGYLWASFPSSTVPYTPAAPWTDSGGTMGPRGFEQVERLGPGRYRVHLPDLAPFQSSTANVTGYGPDATYASIENWVGDGGSGTNVTVTTWSPTGAPMDAMFSLSYLTNRPRDEASWATFGNSPLAAGATANAPETLEYTPGGERITIQRNATTTNLYHVKIPHTVAGTGAIHVSPYGGAHFAVVKRVYVDVKLDTVVDVLQFEANGLPATAPLGFTILSLRPADPAAAVAWRICDDPTTPTNPALPRLGWNGERPSPTVSRTGLGTYNVRFPGLAPTGNEHGHVQVTPIGTVPFRAHVRSWGRIGTDISVDIECHNLAGALFNGEFVASYHEFAVPMPERQGSGTHLWANNPTNTTYAPHIDYVDSNGTLGPSNVELIHRVGTGRYEVTLPNVATFPGSHAQVTGYGAGDHYAVIDGWTDAPGGGALVRVSTYSAPNTLTDGRFTLLYLTDHPAVGTAGTNSTYGAGCNGAVMTALTRPVLGTTWDLRLVSVPVGTTVAFVQFGLIDPNQPVGPQAPGCTIYTSGDVTALVLTPIPNPAYGLPIPNDPTLIGLPLRAQGGAFAPGLNALWLAVSGGTLGVVGDI
ncbi:MAG: hypothetical protein KDE27_29585 [Planctomycetes bacterium]|nr:hypothetical protein [Planctomycetota bacterium]